MAAAYIILAPLAGLVCAIALLVAGAGVWIALAGYLASGVAVFGLLCIIALSRPRRTAPENRSGRKANAARNSNLIEQ